MKAVVVEMAREIAKDNGVKEVKGADIGLAPRTARRWASLRGIMGDRLKAIREARGMSRLELAQALGVTRGFIQHIETNRTNPDLRMLIQMAAVLGVPPGALLPDPRELGYEVAEWEPEADPRVASTEMNRR